MWGKCTTSAECKTIRIAVSAVMDVLAELLKVRCWFCFQKDLKTLFWNSIHCGEGALGREPVAVSLVTGG